MSRNSIIGTVIGVIVIIILAWYFFSWNSYKKTTTTSTSTTVVTPVDSVKQLKGIIDQQIAIINKLIDKCGGREGGSKPRTTVKKPVKKTGRQTPYVPNQGYTGPIDNRSTTTTTTQTTSTTSTTTGGRLDQIYYEGNAKDILFCVRLGGDQSRHLPHLAMLSGETFGDAIPNDQSGFNWHVFKLADGISGEYGITHDGEFFVSKALIDRYLCDSDKGIVEIKTTATGWQPRAMTLKGEFYTFKRK